MKYNQPYGGSADASYVNGDPSIGRAGSIPPAAAIENPQREIVNLINDVKNGDGSAFAVGTDADLAQLAKAVQSLLMNYGRDSGTLNSCQVTLTPVPTAYYEGMTLFMKVANTNTGASVVNVNALGAKPIVKMDGTPLQGSEMVIGMEATLRYDGANFQLLGASGSSFGRLTTNKDLYVNDAIGNDTNDGISNTAGHALKTIQKAIDIAFNYAPSQYVITIHIAAGTYTAGGRTPLFPGNALTIVGAGIGSTFVNPTNDYAFLVQGPNVMTVTDVMCTPNVPFLGPSPFTAGGGAVLKTNNTKSGACATAIFVATQSGSVYPVNHTFAGNMAYGYEATYNGNISVLNATITFSAAITVSQQFIGASGIGVVVFPASTPTTFQNPGNLTGQKYLAASNGVVNADGQGVNFFPGTVAGSTASGGQYT